MDTPSPDSGTSATGRTREPPQPRTILHVEDNSVAPSQQIVKGRTKTIKVKSGKPHITSKLVGPIRISFIGLEERMRAQTNLLPPFGYRTSGEKSGTLSLYQPPDCHAQNRDVDHLKLAEGHAFRNHAEFDASRDMVPERIPRHYIPNKTKEPSSFVSSYGSEGDALAKANTMYHISRIVQRRVTVAEIEFANLIPATLHGELQVFSAVYKDNTLNYTAMSEKTRPVKYPVWIRDTARPADGSSITIQQFYDSGADMWLCGLEMRKTGKFDMNCGSADTHDDEWLCCGPVPESIIKNVMPFDGEKLHRKKGSELVISKDSIEKYVWNFDRRIYEHNPDTTDYRPYRLSGPGDKRWGSERDADEDEVTGNGDQQADPEPRLKRPKFAPRRSGAVPAARIIRK